MMFSDAELGLFLSVAQENDAIETRFVARDPQRQFSAIQSRLAPGAVELADDVTCLIPFGGDHTHLEDCLSSIIDQTTAPGSVIVGLDYDGPPPRLPERLALQVRLQRASAPGAGPFRMMEELIAAASTPYLQLQDSDDLALPGRLRAQLSALKSGDLAAVGCAVINFEEQEVESIGIFPDDPAQALSKMFGPACLYPSLLLRRDTFDSCGGFAHLESFGIDTELVVRLTAWGSVRNLAEPMYMKRSRKLSLTQASDTGFGSERRKAVDRATRAVWSAHFQSQKDR